MRATARAAIDASAEGLVRWLGSRAAFVQVCLATLVSVPLTIYGIDSHGLVYLYLATALSLITQVPLAMIGQRAREEARKAGAAAMRQEEAQIQMLINQQDSLKAILRLLADDSKTKALIDLLANDSR